nr:MAG TPA: hypothetical protein [Caudoviricetes sp.]
MDANFLFAKEHVNIYIIASSCGNRTCKIR